VKNANFSISPNFAPRLAVLDTQCYTASLNKFQITTAQLPNYVI